MRYGLLLCAVFLLVGCQPKKSATVTHVVVCWLKIPGDAAQQQQLIDESAKLRKIPGVMDVTAGRAMPSDRPVVDSTFDVAIVIDFEDERSLRAYDNHPLHIQAVSEVLRPLTSKVLIYDIAHGSPGAHEKAGTDSAPASQSQQGPQEQLFTPR